MPKDLVALVLIGIGLAAASPAAQPPVRVFPDAGKANSASLSSHPSSQESLQRQRESLDKQRQSIHQQLGQPTDNRKGAVGDFVDPFPPLPAFLAAQCEPLESDLVDSLISDAAQKQTVPAALLRAVMKQESAFRPCAVSERGAQGLMQLMPPTAQQFHVSNPFDPGQSVQGGAAFLKQLLTRYKGDVRLALGAYNAGPLRADQSTDRPFPDETQSYLANILADMDTSVPEADAPPKVSEPVFSQKSTPEKSPTEKNLTEQNLTEKNLTEKTLTEKSPAEQPFL